MLKTLRIVLATLCFTGFFLLFFIPDAPNFIPGLEFLAKVQLIPAILSGSLVVAGVLVLLTWLFGRVYCSMLCPLGLMQDLLAVAAPAKRFRFKKAVSTLRNTVLFLFAAAMISGVPILFSLVEPYSVFGRILANAVSVGRAFLNRMTDFGETLSWTTGAGPAVMALVLFFVIAVMAWKWGRLWCNSVCPVGTFLGWLSRYSLIGIRIDREKCVSCGLCERTCKASCINAGDQTVDKSRCVVCFNCTKVCRHQALHFSVGLPASSRQNILQRRES